ncbi:MAG: hypothetical protein ABI680_07670 [Chthoniobacteraceae bacterium]
MIERAQAEENLRVIRSLMEKATIYRSISAEAAAVGGALAVLSSLVVGNPWRSEIRAASASAFVSVWLGILIITAASNFFFLWKDARRRDEMFVSSGMRLALRALLPSYIVAGAFTVSVWFGAGLGMVVSAWIICHGLGLLATSHFAPQSLTRLGWAFLIAGLISIVPLCVAHPVAAPGLRSALAAPECWMAGTFGLFHLIYAACTWPRKAKA